MHMACHPDGHHHRPEGSMGTVKLPLTGQMEDDLFTAPTDVVVKSVFAQAIQTGGIEADLPRDTPRDTDDITIQLQESKGCPADTMTFAQLIGLIQEPLASNNTARALIVATRLPLSEEASCLLTTVSLPLLTCPHEWSQTAAAKFLADSQQSDERWQQIIRSALAAAMDISQASCATSRAKSIRNLIAKAVTGSPSTTVVAILKACTGATVPPHISELLGKLAVGHTSVNEAPEWHKVLGALAILDEYQVIEHSPTRVSLVLQGALQDKGGDPCTQLLWNVNGFSSRWKSCDVTLDSDVSEGQGNTAKKNKRVWRSTRRNRKADFKAVVCKAGSPDLITVIESKLSLRKMISLPGFIQWCQDTSYHYISLAWSENSIKGGAGYAGVMTLCKFKPLSTLFDLNNMQSDEARVITHHFPSFVHVSVYSPCTGYSASKMESRVGFDNALNSHLVFQKGRSGKPMICAGDFNVNPRRQDWHEKAFASLRHLKDVSKSEYHPGCSPLELEGYKRLLSSSNMVNMWEHLYPHSSRGMTWHPPTDPHGFQEWGQRLDHFLLTEDFLSNTRGGFTVDSMVNLRGEGSSDHNGLLLNLYQPGVSPSVYTLDVLGDTNVVITNLDNGRTKVFKAAECPRVSIETFGRPTQVLLDTGAPFSIYNPPAIRRQNDFYLAAATSTGSKSNCFFAGATGGHITAEQNYIMSFRVGAHVLQGHFVVLATHEKNLPMFLFGMDLLMGPLQGVAVIPDVVDQFDKISVYFGVDWTTRYHSEGILQIRHPPVLPPKVSTLLEDIDEQLVEKYLPLISKIDPEVLFDNTPISEQAFIFGDPHNFEGSSPAEQDFFPVEDFSYVNDDGETGFQDCPLPVVQVGLAIQEFCLEFQILIDSGATLNLISQAFIRQLLEKHAPFVNASR